MGGRRILLSFPAPAALVLARTDTRRARTGEERHASPDVANQPERFRKRFADQGEVFDDVLTLKDRETLGGLALCSAAFAETGETLSEASRELALLVTRYPELEKAFSELCAKMRRLAEAGSELGNEVMRFSHLYEDAVEVVGDPNMKRAGAHDSAARRQCAKDG